MIRERLHKALAYVLPLPKPVAKDLETEVAGPQTTGVRQLVSGHPAQGLTPAKLAGLLRGSENADPTAYFELAEEMEEKDLHFAAVLGVRKRAIRGMSLIVEAASDDARDQEAAEFVDAQMKQTAVQLALQDVLDGLGKGYSVSEIMWRRDGKLWEIGSLDWRFPQWFEPSREDGRTLLIRDIDGLKAMPPAKFVIHRPSIKSGLPIRGGLARLAAWAYLFKNYTLRDWAIFCEAYGHPFRLGKYGPTATDKEKATLLRAVRNIGADMAAIVPESMTMEFVSASLSGNAQFYEKAARYWDEQVSKGVLGQVATTDAIAGGHAVGKIHEAVRDDIRDADAEQLAATLERDLAAPLTAFNFGPETGVPSIRFEASDEIPIGDFITGVQAMVGMGMPVASRPVYERYGLQPPQDDEDVIAGKTAPPTPEENTGDEDEEPETQEPDEGGEDAETLARTLVQALAAHRHGRSSIDDLVDAMNAELGFGSRPDLGLADIEAALASATSIDGLKTALAGLADVETRPEQLADLLARGMAAARTAGLTGAPVLDDEPQAE